MADKKGRWVTVMGRRIFIEDGKTLQESMEGSGASKTTNAEGGAGASAGAQKNTDGAVGSEHKYKGPKRGRSALTYHVDEPDGDVIPTSVQGKKVDKIYAMTTSEGDESDTIGLKLGDGSFATLVFDGAEFSASSAKSFSSLDDMLAALAKTF